MRIKDPDVFDLVERAHFDDGSRAVTTDDLGLWAYRLRTKYISKMLAVISAFFERFWLSPYPYQYGYRSYHSGLFAHT